ncbi:hypothetical protein MMYC01_202207 [Madurella mycetomatis]|uniref:Uncharacterized protein n=1 Tax=Madurella mycetomatis TaxID=100816 RepID=A0A175WD78_9PEZI|nr:hypothetical protein MMYC01_202207 [Madurella mycetomatis]
MQRKVGRTPSARLSRLKPVETDPLAEYGLPSKGEKRLLSPKVQEAYYAKIAERYLAFCTDAGDRNELQKQFARLARTSDSTSPTPSPSPTTSQPPSTSNPPKKPATTDLPPILVALRKLREALVASARRDTFAAQVYLFAIRLGILASSFETYYPALLYLLHTLHASPGPGPGPSPSPSPTSTSTTSTATATAASILTTTELHECQSYLVLDAACRRSDLPEAYALRYRFRLADGKVDAALKALAHDNWVAWRRVKRSVDGHRARIMEFAEGGMRDHTLRAFGRAYLSVEAGFLEGAVGVGWEELRARFGVGWELEGGDAAKDARVVIRRVKGRGG